MERSVSSPDLQRGRCASAGRLRPSPTRVPIAALHWSPGGRCPEALKACWLSQGRCFSGGSCQGFGRCSDSGRLGFEGRRVARSSRASRAAEWASRIGRVPISPILGGRPELATLTISPELAGLAISGSRPASASVMSRKSPLEIGRSTTETRAPSSEFGSCSHAAAVWPLQLSGPTLGRAQEETNAKEPALLTVSLVASVSGEMLGTVALRSETQARALQAVLRSVHDGGHCVRSTVEFWDGDVAGSAEGVLRITKTGKSSYEISHNFLELSRVDAGATLSFEDTPEMRIVVEGPSSGALIRIEPLH